MIAVAGVGSFLKRIEAVENKENRKSCRRRALKRKAGLLEIVVQSGLKLSRFLKMRRRFRD